jgi:multiple sugar transport system substrate-binding protein
MRKDHGRIASNYGPITQPIRRVNIQQAITRREFLHSAGVLAAGALLAACDIARSNSTPTSVGPVQIVYQDWSTEWFPPMAQKMLEQFHASHTNVQVFYVPDPADVEQSLISDMRIGTAPDVFDACCSFFPIIGQEKLAVDLRPFVKDDLDQRTINDWDPAQYKALFSRDGRQYGLPKYHGALALYFNKDLFDLYGVDYPDSTWDYDDYRQAMLRLTHDRDGDGQTDLWGSMLDVSWERIQVHVNAWGGNFVDSQDPRISRMGEPEALAAMEWIRARMWDDKTMATFLDVNNLGTRQAFIEQRVAMIEDGSWALKDILSGATFRIGLAPMPAGPIRRATLATTDGFGIYTGTRHLQEAWELLKFLISEDYGLAMAKANFLQPARASLVDQWVKIVQDEYPQSTKDLDIAVFADGHLQGYSVTAEAFPNMDDAIRLAYAAWDQIFTLGQAQVEIMKDVSLKIQELQKDSSS